MIPSKKSISLPREAVEEFQKLYLQHYGEALDFDEALQRCMDLLQVVSLCCELTNQGGINHE